MHKRKIMSLMLLIVILLLCLVGCNCSGGNGNLSKTNKRENNGKFSVHYLDVGQGDAIFIYFPDGKTMLIDSGDGEKKNNEYITEFLKDFEINKIDYLVLTHPDSDHIGGAKSVVENFDIGKAFIPHLLQPQNFKEFNDVYNILNQKQIQTDISCTYKNIKTEDYSVAFLLPYPTDFPGVESSYAKLNGEYPTETEINDASPIIYVEYKGTRFLFTGDASSVQERVLLENECALTSMFKVLGINLKFEYIDFLKVAHHGANDSSSQAFLNFIKPKNAIISVGGANNYGHPSTLVLERLATANPAHTLYRTDVYGTVSVYVSNDGNTQVITDFE